MRILTWMLIAVSLLALGSTLICGLFIRGQGEGIGASSLQFHFTLGLFSVLVTMAALIVVLVRVIA
jgi:hypothetical protein